METPKDRRRLLYVVRHAKSSWKDDALEDLDRPLSPRGRRAVGLLAARFRRSGLSPALVLCSPARRTLETYQGIRTGFTDDVDMWTDEALYGADVGDLLDVIRSVPEAVPSLMVIGHNPGLQDLVLKLAGAGSDDDGSITRVREKFPTGAVATLAHKGSWKHLARGNAKLVAYMVPRELESES
jgi:phosphohistidine phosphatase